MGQKPFITSVKALPSQSQSSSSAYSSCDGPHLSAGFSLMVTKESGAFTSSLRMFTGFWSRKEYPNPSSLVFSTWIIKPYSYQVCLCLRSKISECYQKILYAFQFCFAHEFKARESSTVWYLQHEPQSNTTKTFHCVAQRTHLHDILDFVELAEKESLHVHCGDTSVWERLQLPKHGDKNFCITTVFSTCTDEFAEVAGVNLDKVLVNFKGTMDMCSTSLLQLKVTSCMLWTKVSDMCWIVQWFVLQAIGHSKSANPLWFCVWKAWSLCKCHFYNWCYHTLFSWNQVQEICHVSMNCHGVDSRWCSWNGEAYIRVWSLKNSGFSQRHCADNIGVVLVGDSWTGTPWCCLRHKGPEASSLLFCMNFRRRL